MTSRNDFWQKCVLIHRLENPCDIILQLTCRSSKLPFSFRFLSSKICRCLTNKKLVMGWHSPDNWLLQLADMTSGWPAECRGRMSARPGRSRWRKPTCTKCMSRSLGRSSLLAPPRTASADERGQKLNNSSQSLNPAPSSVTLVSDTSLSNVQYFTLIPFEILIT